MAPQHPESQGDWVLLTYRLPREPSTPRITVWRKLRQLGAAQLGDGLVALPADARTREQLEWVAERVRQAGGVADLWSAQPLSPRQERDVAARMAADRAREYVALQDRAAQGQSLPKAQRQRYVRSLRTELRRIRRRDFFPPAERDAAVAAVELLAEDTSAAPSDGSGASRRSAVQSAPGAPK